MTAPLFTVSLEEFARLAQEFCSRQRSLNDVWEMKTTVSSEGETSDAYLVKCCTMPWDTGSQDSVVGAREEPACSDDPAALPPIPLSAPVHLEYHAVYSHTYQVPVLYLTASHSNGQRLTLEEVWSLVPRAHHTRLDAAKWSTLTEGEHPVTGTPFYFVHPCQTGQVMATIVGHEGGEPGEEPCVDYFTSWLSMFGSLVGLELPLGTAQPCKQDSPTSP